MLGTRVNAAWDDKSHVHAGTNTEAGSRRHEPRAIATWGKHEAECAETTGAHLEK